MKITTIVGTNSLKQNTYIVEDKNTIIMIDCGSSLELILEEYRNENNKDLQNLDAIFLTHTHFDHTLGLKDVLDKFNTPVFVKADCVSWISNPYYNASGMFARPLDFEPPVIKEISTENKILVKNLVVTPYFTPGHTDCSMCFKIGNFLFTGDTKFYLSVGRTDLPTGSDSKLVESLEKIKHINCDLCYPGHGIPFKN